MHKRNRPDGPQCEPRNTLSTTYWETQGSQQLSVEAGGQLHRENKDN